MRAADSLVGSLSTAIPALQASCLHPENDGEGEEMGRATAHRIDSSCHCCSNFVSDTSISEPAFALASWGKPSNRTVPFWFAFQSASSAPRSRPYRPPAACSPLADSARTNTNQTPCHAESPHYFSSFARFAQETILILLSRSHWGLVPLKISPLWTATTFFPSSMLFCASQLTQSL
jgi:hypothetical protein